MAGWPAAAGAVWALTHSLAAGFYLTAAGGASRVAVPLT